MNTFMSGFGDVAVQSQAVQQPSVWDKVGNILTNVVQPAANIYTQVTTKPSSGSPTGVANTTMYPNPSPGGGAIPYAGSDDERRENARTMKKYLTIGGVTLALATGIYFATRKKKK
jgi:hypothetical protein